MYMVNLVHVHCVHVYSLKQGKARQRPKVDSEEKNTELPQTGFESVITGLLVQCSANRAIEAAQLARFRFTVI